MKPLVSVVIPARNSAKYLGDAIRSVLEQQGAELEIIVVDNGSSDETRTLAEGFGPPVHVIDEPQLGAAHARNSGVRIAQGEYLAFLDADDLWLPGKLARQLAALEASHNLDMVFTFGANFLSPELTEEERKAVVCDTTIGPFIMPGTMLARRASFLRAGPLPDLQEGEFIAWYGVAGSIGLRSYVIPEVFLHRRVHLTNSTRMQSRPADLLRAAKMVLDAKRAHCA
jgi:glycosyltransferase involved in cell wall biosynthesis